MIEYILRLTLRIRFQFLLAVLAHLPVKVYARRALVPQVVVTVIGGNAAEPSGKRRLEVITPNASKRLNENFLSKVFHFIAPPNQMINQREYPLLMFLHQRA